MKHAFRIAMLVALTAFAAHAQTAPSDLPGYSVSLFAGYSATTGNQTNNGFFSSVAIPVHQFQSAFGKQYGMNLAVRGDYFSISKPSTYVLTGGPELRFQISKPDILNGQVLQPFINIGMGGARSQCVSDSSCAPTADQSTHFAAKVGGGLDIPISAKVNMRIFEIDFIHSTIFPTGNVVVSNFAQISAGIGLKF